MNEPNEPTISEADQLGQQQAEHEREQAEVLDLTRRIEHLSARSAPDAPAPRRYLLTNGTHGLVPMGCVSMLAADGGSGKTRLALRLAAVATAESDEHEWALGWKRAQPMPMRALVILAEEDEGEVARAQRRLANAFPSCLLGLDWLSLVAAGPMLLANEAGPIERAHTLARVVQQAGYDLVVIDPLVSFHACDENNNAQMQRVVEALRLIASTGCAVLACHHSAKGTTESTNAARGASSLRDGARLLLTLKHVGKEIECTVAKSNYGPIGARLGFWWRDDDFKPCVLRESSGESSGEGPGGKEGKRGWVK